MQDNSPTGQPIPPATLDALLDTALKAKAQGNPAAARSLLRALSARAPDEARVWLALATVAATREEQYGALEQALALRPDNPGALKAIARLRAADPRLGAATSRPGPPPTELPTAEPARNPFETPRYVTTAPAEPPQAASSEPALPPATPLAQEEPLPEDEPVRPARWPLYVVLGIALLVLIAASALIRRPEQASESTARTPLPALLGTSAATAAAGGVEQPTAGVSVPTAPITGAGSATTAPVAGAPTAAALATAAPAVPTPQTSSQIGDVVQQGDWSVGLLRPQDALVLDGSIGSLEPQGRYVLALVAVGNGSSAPRRIPEDLIALTDGSGNRYAPLPSASTAYLSTFGVGKGGDLSLEDAIPEGGGIVSVPLIFDVPASARNLTLTVGQSASGWRIAP